MNIQDCIPHRYYWVKTSVFNVEDQDDWNIATLDNQRNWYFFGLNGWFEPRYILEVGPEIKAPPKTAAPHPTLYGKSR